MWIKRIGIGIMVLLLLGQAYRLVAVYQEKTTYRATIARVTAAK